VTDTLTPVLSANWGNDRAWTIDGYRHAGGYRALTASSRAAIGVSATG
jgi:NADH-quinone oxidoreductase subunit F